MLHLNSLPTWSRVWIDGKPHGTTPVKVRLPAGRHRVTLRALGRGEPVRFQVTVRPRRTTTRIHTFR
jgi:outer membrane biogenesis lipoprotein LolB